MIFPSPRQLARGDGMPARARNGSSGRGTALGKLQSLLGLLLRLYVACLIAAPINFVILFVIIEGRPLNPFAEPRALLFGAFSYFAYSVAIGVPLALAVGGRVQGFWPRFFWITGLGVVAGLIIALTMVGLVGILAIPPAAVTAALCCLVNHSWLKQSDLKIF